MTATIRETNVFTDVFTCLNGKLSSVPDPTSKSKFVWASFPEKLIDKPESYPLITITSADVSYAPLTLRTVKRGPVRFAIDVFSTKAKELDSLSDQIVDKMETEENNFQTSGIVTMRMTGTSYVQYPREKFRVHNKTINYEFDFGWY